MGIQQPLGAEGEAQGWSLAAGQVMAELRDYLARRGVETESLGKKDVAALMKDAEPELTEVLKLRQQISKSSVKKYLAMQEAVCEDGR